MKKILLTLALCCISLSSAFAQRYYDDRTYYDDYSRFERIFRTGTVASYFDLHFGEGIGRGSKGFGGASVAFLYRFSPEFQFGVGGGADYIHALALQGKSGKKNEYDYHGELTVPVFMRGRFLMGDVYSRSALFFLQCDLGYRFGITAYNTGKNDNLFKKIEKCNVTGLFAEPQLGIAPNDFISISLGLPLQRYTKYISDQPVANTDSSVQLKTKDLTFLGAEVHFMVNF